MSSTRDGGVDRRTFIATSAAAAATVGGFQQWMHEGHAGQPAPIPDLPILAGKDHRGICCVASGNGKVAVDEAMMHLRDDQDPADAVVAGVGLVESDPNDMSVGYGGLPNEDGVVQLDASVMHGPTHKAGAVAAIENIMNPAAVALTVLRRTDHVMLVGDGARRFAVAHGFKEENLLTDKARRAWLRWKENLNPNDDWLDDDQRDSMAAADPEPLPFTYGTIHCAAVTEQGAVAATTTTSGLSYKIPGRVGDSPIIGAGMYVDNEIGAAGATGRGEAVIQSCGAYSIVEAMGRGLDPTDACLETLRKIARRTVQKRLLNARGQPNFNVSMYALRKDGAFGGASLWEGGTVAVHDGASSRVYKSAYVYPRV